MKILHVLISPRAEGTPRLVLDWLSVKGHEQHVLFLESHPDNLLSQFPKEQYTLNHSLVTGVRKIFQIKRLVKKTCEKEHSELVISWTTGLSQWVLWGARLSGVKLLIAHCGNAPGKTFMGRYIWTYLSFWMNKWLGAKIICCSNYIKNEYCKIPFVPASIFYSVYNCLNVSRFLNLKEVSKSKYKSIIMVATLESHKDHRTLIDAWQNIENKGYDFKLLLAGNGSLETKIRSQVNALGLKSVVFLGTRNDIPELLAQSDLFVLSTTPNEGFGTVLIEALASGLKIIASDVPACREVLNDGEYGILIEPNNPSALADAIIKCFNMPVLDQEMKDKYIKYAQSFSPENMIKSYIEIAMT